MTNTTRQDARRRRALAVALAVGAALVPIVANAAATVPDEPAGVPIALAESTFTFGDGPYHWASTHGSVLDVDGEVILDEGTVTFLATTSGTLLVPQDGSDPSSSRPARRSPATRHWPPRSACPPASRPGTWRSTSRAATPQRTPPPTRRSPPRPRPLAATSPRPRRRFAPGAGARTVTLHSVVVDPSASFDAGIDRAEFGYVVVTKGVFDTASGETLYTFDTLALPGDGVLTNPSGSVAAEILVATVTGPPRDARRRVSCRRGHTICAP